MSEPTTVARPYAKAAFASATAHSNVAAWSATLLALQPLLADDTMRHTVSHPLLPAKRIGGLIIAALEDSAPENLDDRMRNFIYLLAENHRLPLIPHIATLFEEYRAQSEQRIEAQVVSAMALSDEQQKSLTEALSRRLNAQVVLNCSLDKSLLAGAVIRAGRLSIDGSLKAQLQKLSTALDVSAP